MLKPLTAMAIIIVTVLLISETIFGQFSSIRLIGSRGKVTVVGVGVYWDPNCTSPVYSMDWGKVEPNSVKNVTVFIRNEGNEPANLFLNTTNWNPTNASDYITLTWNYDGHTLNPQETTKATLTLSIAQTTSGIKDFTFDIIMGVY